MLVSYTVFPHALSLATAGMGIFYFLAGVLCQSSGKPKERLTILMFKEGIFLSSLITFFLRVFHKILKLALLMKHWRLIIVEYTVFLLSSPVKVVSLWIVFHNVLLERHLKFSNRLLWAHLFRTSLIFFKKDINVSGGKTPSKSGMFVFIKLTKSRAILFWSCGGKFSIIVRKSPKSR